MKKDLLSLYDLTKDDIDKIIRRASILKAKHKQGEEYYPLKGKTLGMIFEKPSTRTRVSFETGIFQLGGQAIFLRWADTQLGRGESTHDTAKALSRYIDAIMIRTFSQTTVEDLASFADIPVINGLTDHCHPCQILADILTVYERRGSFDGLKAVYIGDGNNIAVSWINVALRLGFDLTLACPDGHGPDVGVLSRAQKEASSKIVLITDPVEAAKGADVISTDTWVSMGQEEERQERLDAFKGYQVNEELIAVSKEDVMIMHCLPAHRGEEISDGVIDGRNSVVFDQAENRLHAQKAVLEILMGNRTAL